MKTFFDIFLDAIEELYKAQKQALTASFNSYAIDQKIEEIKLRKSFKNII
jgi:ferritin-like metal-binding protein YciE